MKGAHEITQKTIDIPLPQKARRESRAPKVIGVTAGVIAGLLGTLAAAYCIASSTVIYPLNSTLSCELGTINIGLKTTAQAENLLLQSIDNYSYQIKTQSGKNYNVFLTDLTSGFDTGSISSKLSNLKKSCLRTAYDTSISGDLAFDDAKIQGFLDRTVKEQGGAVPSEDAKIIYSDTDHAFIIEPEKQGNIMTENAGETLKENLLEFNKGELNLSDLGCYEKPKLLHDDPALQAQLIAHNNYAKATITYNAGPNTEELTPDQYFSWLSIAEGGSVEVNQDSVLAYVEGLSAKYNTYGYERPFATSTGAQVQLTRGDYGWLVNQSKMVADITEKILNQDSTPSDLIFAQYAEKLWDGSDFGNSYVEISIDNQQLWMYVNGTCIVDSPIVTGCVSKGHSTPKGIYTLKFKQRDTVLKGEDYESPVSFWMPFNGGIGMHDATWRGEFGGSIYQNNGSHGCVNLPYDNAKMIFENLSNTMPIIVW